MICAECETVALCSRNGECHFQKNTELLDKHAKFTTYDKLVIINHNGIRKITDVQVIVRDDGDKCEVVDVRMVK